MRSAWPWGIKALLTGLILVALPLGVGSWWSQYTARAIAATAPLRSVCQSYVEGAWKLEGRIESLPDDAESVSVQAVAPNVQRLHATFLEMPRYTPPGAAPPAERVFFCTVRPAEMGYKVTGFRWQ